MLINTLNKNHLHVWLTGLPLFRKIELPEKP